ncbi:hypothetical protein AVL61_13735 [Kocuria rosea subsp. polaris]|uniref:Uncharacterized protein n=1 Tax=Kocuria rosea subsp. polaris TaxID=136273 RepID=A0A0W8IL06_KOCRO|nr:hypothetical protein [Kocuria polaris]KUG60775.1 hypothetical protein AVL61_13735 [Kocuria polaris]
MNRQRRLTAASAAAVLGLFLAGCDNTDNSGTEAPPEAPAETAPATILDQSGPASAPTAEQTGMGDDATTDTGAEGTAPEGDAGDAGGAGTGADTDAEAGTDN